MNYSMVPIINTLESAWEEGVQHVIMLNSLSTITLVVANSLTITMMLTSLSSISIMAPLISSQTETMIKPLQNGYLQLCFSGARLLPP